MTRFNRMGVGLAVLALVGCTILAPAGMAADYNAKAIIELIKDGKALEDVDGVNGALRNPVIDNGPDGGTLRGPAIYEGTEHYLTTLGQNYLTVQQTTLTFDDVPVPLLTVGSGTNGVGGVKIFDFPEGRILLLGATVSNITVAANSDTNAGLDATDGGDFGFGTVTGAGTDITSTEVDLIPKTSLDPIATGVGAALAASAQFDGTTTPVDMYYNMILDAGDITRSATGVVNGTIRFTWVNLGDY